MDQGLVTKAEELLASFQKTAYVFGSGVLDRVGPIAADLGRMPWLWGIPLIPGAFYSGWFKA